MEKKHRRGIRTLAVFLAFVLVQLIQLSLPTSASTLAEGPQQPPQFIARLTATRNGQPILVNGNSTPVGSAITPGSIIETGADQSATLQIGRFGSVALEPNSSIQLDYERTGNVRVKLARGCVVMKKRGDGVGEIYTADGASEKTRAYRKQLSFCYATGGTLEPFNKRSGGN